MRGYSIMGSLLPDFYISFSYGTVRESELFFVIGVSKIKIEKIKEQMAMEVLAISASPRGCPKHIAIPEIAKQ